ncbi:uncharacterized protein K02A2.6 [Trichonephila clavipes]|nr:uncharacterized protein K02A2.6 [Trichonephila clavipes]
MDDVIISSPSFTQHVKHLKEVFRLLHEAGLTLNKDKCKFGCEELKYLGLIINKEGIKTDETKVQAIVEMKPLRNSKEASKFLGMSQCSIGVEAVLNQEQRPVVFASRTLRAAERNYTVTERECLAVVWALNKFRTYLVSLPIKVTTDHAALTHLTTGKNLSNKMIIWALKLAEFNIEWEHRPGTQNTIADVLSRNPIESIIGEKVNCAIIRYLVLSSRDKLIEEQKTDPELGHIYRYLENPEDSSVNAAICENWSRDFRLVEGPYPVSRVRRNRYVLIITDHFSKWAEILPLKNAAARVIADNFFDNYTSRFGAPIKLYSDNGPQFISDIFENLSEILGIRHVKTVVYRPQANRTERVNRDLVQMIANYINEQHDTWDQFLREFAYAIRTVVNETTGKTPAELFLCIKIITPFQKLVMVSEGTEFAVGDIERLFEEARRNTETKHENWKKYYNRRRCDVQIKVRIYRHRKCDETEIGTGSSDNGSLHDESSGFDRVQRRSNDSRDGKKKGSEVKRELEEKGLSFRNNQGEKHTNKTNKRGPPLIRSIPSSWSEKGRMIKKSKNQKLGYKRANESRSGGPERKVRKGSEHRVLKRNLSSNERERERDTNSVFPNIRKKSRREETVAPTTSGYNLRPRIGKREESRPTIERKAQQRGPVRSRKGR